MANRLRRRCSPLLSRKNGTHREEHPLLFQHSAYPRHEI
jgi:hypothetical protein